MKRSLGVAVLLVAFAGAIAAAPPALGRQSAADPMYMSQFQPKPGQPSRTIIYSALVVRPNAGKTVLRAGLFARLAGRRFHFVHAIVLGPWSPTSAITHASFGPDPSAAYTDTATISWSCPAHTACGGGGGGPGKILTVHLLATPTSLRKV